MNATLRMNMLTAATKPSISNAITLPVNLPTSNLTWWLADVVRTGIVNKSNDLLWLCTEREPNYSLKIPGAYKLKKYDYSNNSILSYNVTIPYLSRSFYMKLVSGDTAIIQDKLMNTNTMSQIRSMPSSFSDNMGSTKAAMFNGKLIYSQNYHNRDYNNQIFFNGVFEYDLNTGVSKTILPNSPEVETYNFDILGEQNDKLWISVSAKQIRWSWGTYNDYNPGTYFFKNLILDTKGTSIISISKNGFAQLEAILKYDMGGSSLLRLNDIGIRPGTESNSRNRLSFPIRADARYSSYLSSYKGPPCLNNEVAPLNNGPGYFYSKN